MHQVMWTNRVLEEFIKQACLSEDEAFIMRTRVKDNWPISKQAIHLNRSEQCIHKMVARLKKKYDAVQKESPDIFPVRKKSSKELYMDNN